MRTGMRYVKRNVPPARDRDNWKRYPRDPVLAKSRRLKARFKKFGMTVAEFDALWESQRGVCALCQQPIQLGDGDRDPRHVEPLPCHGQGPGHHPFEMQFDPGSCARLDGGFAAGNRLSRQPWFWHELSFEVFTGMNDTNTRRAGLLRVAGPFLAHVLNLPAGHTVRSMRVTRDGELELEIHGEHMPPVTEGWPASVTLELTDEHTTRPGFRGKFRRTVARWAHRPTRSWIISDWAQRP